MLNNVVKLCEMLLSNLSIKNKKISSNSLHRDAELVDSQWHPLVEFNNGSSFDKVDEPCLPMSDYADALSRLSRWLINESEITRSKRKGGRQFYKDAVAVRAIALNFFLNPESVNCKTQSELATKLGVSKQRVSTVVQEFQRKFQFKVFSSNSPLK